jgi:hypothetical protein
VRGSLATFSAVQSNAQMSQNLSRWKFFPVGVKFPRWRSLHLPMCLQSCRAAASEASPIPRLAGFFTSPHSSPPHATLRPPSDLGYRRRSIRFLRSVGLVLAAGERGDGLLCRDSATNAVLTGLAPTQTIDSKPLESYSQTQIQHKNG